MTVKRVSVAAATLVTALLATAVGAPAAGEKKLVVDDDMQQCPNARYASINAAITAASPGDRIIVCPGLYNEMVVVNKADLSLQGSTNGSPKEPCLRGDDAANPAKDSVVNGEVRIAANGVSLDGFTVQGAPAPPGVVFPAGITTSPAFSGYTITRNVVQQNPAGINLGSNGVDTTVVRHNCIRRNNGDPSLAASAVGVFAEQGILGNARIESNTSTGHEFISMFLGYGLVAFPVITAPDSDLTVRHNLIVDDGIGGILTSNVSRVEISHNKIIRTGNAITAYPPASGVLIAHNDVEDSLFAGIRVDGNPFGCCLFPTGPTNIALVHNRITGAGTAFPQDGIALNRASGNAVLFNHVERSSRDGISVRDSNGNLVAANHSDENGRDGIRSRGTSSGNTFDRNHTKRNVEHDAHDENRAANTWTRNHCNTDFPPGTICGP